MVNGDGVGVELILISRSEGGGSSQLSTSTRQFKNYLDIRKLVGRQGDSNMQYSQML